MTQWRWPIMFGRGDGGTLSYLMLAQAPDNTAGGAVSIGFAPMFAGEHPLCPGAPKTGSVDGVISYKPFDDVPGPGVLVSPAAVTAEVHVSRRRRRFPPRCRRRRRRRRIRQGD